MLNIAFLSDEEFDTDEVGASPQTVAASYLKRICKVPFKIIPFDSKKEFDLGIVLEAHSHWPIPMDCKAKRLIFIRYKDALVSKKQVFKRATTRLSIRMFENNNLRSKKGIIEPIEVATVLNFEEAIKITCQWIYETNKSPEANKQLKGQLSEEEFIEIIRLIAKYRDNVERLPGVGAPANAGEEAHRDSLIGALSMHFRVIKDVVAEGYSKGGKTDIRILTEKDSYFYGECKMWKGTVSVDEAFEQLINRYMISRDNYGCLVFFILNRKNPEKIQSKIIKHLNETVNATLTKDKTYLTTLEIPSTKDYSKKTLAIVTIEVDSSKSPI